MLCCGCLCNPAQVGGISSQTLQVFVSHPAACVVVALGAVLLNAEVTTARKLEWFILTCLEPSEKCIALAVLSTNRDRTCCCTHTGPSISSVPARPLSHLLFVNV